MNDHQTFKDNLNHFILDNPKSFSKVIKKDEYLFGIVNQYPGDTVGEQCYNALTYTSVSEALNHYPSVCGGCSQPFKKFLGVGYGYQPYCSKQCAAKHKQETGVYQQITQKVKQTNLDRYGVENVFECKDIQEKTKQTNLEKYGVEQAVTSKVVQDKIKKTNLDRYGFESHLSSGEVRNKIKETNVSRYGVENVFESIGIQDQIEATNLKKYGVIHTSQNNEIANKIRDSRKLRFVKDEWDERITVIQDQYQVSLVSSKEEYLEGKPMVWKHICGHEYESSIDGSNDILRCSQASCKNVSSIQRSIFEFIKGLLPNDEILVNDRSVLKPYELDIYIPSKKIAFEIDGLYWHQNTPTINKQELCGGMGIQLIHIDDRSLKRSYDLWKSVIRTKLGMSSKIHARSCKVDVVSPEVMTSFLNENHLQGAVGSTIGYGLFHHGQLVAVMNFGVPRFNTRFTWELLRFSTIKNTVIVGGAGKLLTHFKRLHSGSILSYAKKEYSNGNLYKTLGFELINEGSPSYSYIKGNAEVSRYQAQKHKLKDLLGSKYNEFLSEKDNMKAAGYIIKHDKGSFTFGMSRV
jgi:hypothetical protein